MIREKGKYEIINRNTFFLYRFDNLNVEYLRMGKFLFHFREKRKTELRERDSKKKKGDEHSQ